MSIEKAGSALQSGQKHHAVTKRDVTSGEAESFSSKVKGTQADTAEEKKQDAGDMQAALKQSIKMSIASTGRLLQQNARDIERDNIDKGF